MKASFTIDAVKFVSGKCFVAMVGELEPESPKESNRIAQLTREARIELSGIKLKKVTHAWEQWAKSRKEAL